MAVTWLECGPTSAALGLVGEGGAGPGGGVVDDDRWAGLAQEPAPLPRRVPPEVRRRRTLVAVTAVLLVALALPLSGTGGHSHPIGSALAETGRPVVYTVQPGDSLWSIAERVDPSADPRPLMDRLASQTGSDTVVPGERIVLP
jgi:hypothetical protein